MGKNKFALALAGAAGLCLSSTAFGQVFNSTNVPVAIPAFGPSQSTNAVAGGPASIVGMRVTIDITHTWDADLDIALGAPSGTSYLKLCDDVGGGGDNFSGTVFESGFPSITTGAAPFIGTFSPEGGPSNNTALAGMTALAGFSGFTGTNGNGTWTLYVDDQVGGDSGSINAWSIEFTGTAPPPPPPPPPGDNCANAILAGDGDWAFDTTTATPDGTGCGAGDASNSQWFSYTNTTAGDLAVTVTTCGGAAFDTVLMALNSCGGAVLGCNDDTCGLQSTILYILPAGNTSLIRISGFGAATGSGNLNISSAVPPGCSLSAPVGAQIEAEDCGGNTNGGCNLANSYETISCGNAVVFGSSWAQGGTRDTDWYMFTQYGGGEVSATVNAELPTGVFLLDGNCPPAFFGTAFSNDNLDFCRDITVTGTAPAGPVVVFVSTSTATAALFDGYPCGGGNDYILTVTTTGSCTPLGACCAPAGCSIMTQADCVAAGGNYLGDDTVCENPGGFSFTAGTAALEDIADTGANLFLTDDSSANAPLGFSFNFYGVDYTDCFVGSNGHIGFGAGSAVYVNGPIPSAAVPNNMLYVYWDDLNPGAGGQVLTETRGTAGTDLRFIAQWNNVPQFGNTDSNTFQCIIWENGSVEYRYGTVSNFGGGDVTVGAENADGSAATQVDDNTVLSGTSQTGAYAPGSSNCSSCAWQADGCYADYNNDGNGIDGDDVISFFADWDAGNACADVDGANGVDGDDVIAFFSAWDAGGVGFPGC